jgi:ABC-type Fe3+ transport system permease subunit
LTVDASTQRAGSALTAILVALPMIAVLVAIVQGASGADRNSGNLREHVARVTANTAILVVGSSDRRGAGTRSPDGREVQARVLSWHCR